MTGAKALEVQQKEQLRGLRRVTGQGQRAQPCSHVLWHTNLAVGLCFGGRTEKRSFSYDVAISTRGGCLCFYCNSNSNVLILLSTLESGTVMPGGCPPVRSVLCDSVFTA